MFFSIRRPSQTPQEDLKGFNLQILCVAKFKVLLIKSLSDPSVSSRVPTAWKCNCSLT